MQNYAKEATAAKISTKNILNPLNRKTETRKKKLKKLTNSCKLGKL